MESSRRYCIGVHLARLETRAAEGLAPWLESAGFARPSPPHRVRHGQRHLVALDPLRLPRLISEAHPKVLPCFDVGGLQLAAAPSETGAARPILIQRVRATMNTSRLCFRR
jgi:hypothetical protein